MVKKVKSKEIDEGGDEGDSNQLWEDNGFKKKVEGTLQSYVLTDQCRCVVTDEYFGMPIWNAEGSINSNSSTPALPVCSTDNTLQHTPSHVVTTA